jgi:hypothetical protein
MGDTYKTTVVRLDKFRVQVNLTTVFEAESVRHHFTLKDGDHHTLCCCPLPDEDDPDESWKLGVTDTLKPWDLSSAYESIIQIVDSYLHDFQLLPLEAIYPIFIALSNQKKIRVFLKCYRLKQPGKPVVRKFALEIRKSDRGPYLHLSAANATVWRDELARWLISRQLAVSHKDPIIDTWLNRIETAVIEKWREHLAQFQDSHPAE